MFGKKKAKDPVCGMDVDVKKAVFSSQHQSSTYYFCSASCKTEFEKDPNKYLEKRHGSVAAHHC